jgi:3-oxoacyl-[acyl-carrier-protein] synthase III
VPRVGIRYVSAVPGPAMIWYRGLPGIEREITRLGIPDDETLWGWGFCGRSTGDYAAHLRNGFAGVLAYLDSRSLQIDAVLGCAPCSLNRIHGTPLFVSTLQSEVLGHPSLARRRFELVSGYECVNVLRAIEQACDLLDAGARNVLVLAAEKMDDERSRFQKFSLFSDFCLTLVVTREVEHMEFEIVDIATRVDAAAREDTTLVFSRDLETHATADMLAANGLTVAEVTKLFYFNLYVPIAMAKGKAMGFRADQVYVGNTTECGHCYGADPLINLTAFTGGRDPWLGLLCASGREHAAVCLVRKSSTARVGA